MSWCVGCGRTRDSYFLCCLRPVLPRYSTLLPIRSTSAPSWDFFRFCTLGGKPSLHIRTSTAWCPEAASHRTTLVGSLRIPAFFSRSRYSVASFEVSSSLDYGNSSLAISYASSASASLFMRRTASPVSCASFIGKTGLCMLSRLSAAPTTCCTIWLATRIVSPSPTIGYFPSLPRGPFSLEGLCPRQQTT